MRNLIADLALKIYFKIKGDLNMMAMMYAASIFNERINRGTKQPWVFEDVPAKLKEEVAEILITIYNRPDLVPTEYGGTKE